MSNNSDLNSYHPEHIKLYEAIYGKNLISLGGSSAIDNMFSGLNLNGLKLLDIGFGLGGVAFYLAKKYHIEISGVEIQNWMAEYVTLHSPQDIAHLLEFVTYNEEGKIPFRNSSFDLVYSKGVLNHVHDKESLFREINRVLNLKGLFVIADWIYPEDYLEKAQYHMMNESKASYQKVLAKTGFENIHFRDDSAIFLDYTKTASAKILQNRDFLKREFGEDIYSMVYNYNQKLLEDIMLHRKFAVRILATKK